MPDVLTSLIAFVAEQLRWGDLDDGLEGRVVLIKCSCGARLARLATARPDRPGNSARRANSGGPDSKGTGGVLTE